MNSPVDELNPTWVRWTGSYGVLISGRLLELRKSDMKPSMPFFPLVAVPLRDRLPMLGRSGPTVGVGGTLGGIPPYTVDGAVDSDR